METDLKKVATCKEVCERCCEAYGDVLRWGATDTDDWYDVFDVRNSFYCPVTGRTINNPDNIGSVQPDCPRKIEHLRAANPNISESQSHLFELDHNSYSPERLRFSAEEAVYLDKWQEENRRKAGINSGYTLLEHILCSKEQNPPAIVSQRDAYVAASVIQWLGTNCGLAFMRECEEKIKEVKRNRRVADRLMV